MEPSRDPNLSELLREWKAPGAPPSLDERVLAGHKPWWRVLLTGSIRVPVPLGVAAMAALLAMGAAMLKRPAVPAAAPVSLQDFRPVENPSVRIIHTSYEAR